MTADGEGSRPRRRPGLGWIRAASDRVPTRWFAAIGTGLFLLATAAFGGLATAAETPVAELALGAEHTNDQVSVTVDRVVLIDEFPEAGVYVEGGERVLALVVTARNEWIQPLRASGGSSVTQTFSVEGLGDTPPDSVARYDDATIGPWLQPGVPAQIVLTWAVDADAFADGDDVAVTVNDMTLHTGSFVADGQWWTDPVPAATVVVPVEDVGAGA